MSVVNIFCYKYNNYYNRIIKKEASIEDYGAYSHVEEGVNFNFSDGVNTSQVINTNEDINYVIVVDETTGYINSRWFVIDATYTRNGQHVFELRRDLVADTYEEVLDAPMFIEKATLNDSDPMIFNKEDMSYNQIKKSETLLTDYTEMPWIVGYTDKTNALSGTVSKPNLEDVGILIGTSINNWQYYGYDNGGFKVISKDKCKYRVRYDCPSPYGFGTGHSAVEISNNGDSITQRAYDASQLHGYSSSIKDLSSNKKQSIRQEFKINFDSIYNTTCTFFSASYKTDSQLNTLLAYDGKLIQDTDNRVFKVSVKSIDSYEEVQDIQAGSLFNELNGYISALSVFTGTANASTYIFRPDVTEYKIVIEEQTEYTASYDFSNKMICSDAAYNIFAIPYSDYKVNKLVGGVRQTTNISKSTVISVINDIIKNSGAYLYDIQILPYCPLRDLQIDPAFGIKLSALDYTLDTRLYTEVQDTSHNIVACFFHAPFSQFEFNIYNPITSTDSIKVQSECNMYRLCSPNFASMFEFNAAKNGGVSRFNVDCTYKPYQPYIHVNPEFGLLYGQDFNDARGLVCAGDFSMTTVSDAWKQYQINNKNYQLMFDRQIQNMDINNKYQRAKEIGNAVVGSVTGAASGAAAGMFTAGTAGAIVGGIVGGVGSAGGGIADIAINDKLRSEARDYTKDMFGYQLGNIQALPDTITKIDAFNNNNKLFPILEYYTCTDEEKQALEDKIKYNGMTVMRIGRIRDYLQVDYSYIKGSLIRLDTIDEDFHFVNELANELNKGVFIK